MIEKCAKGHGRMTSDFYPWLNIILNVIIILAVFEGNAEVLS